MDPITMISSFVIRVLGYVKSGIDWRHAVNRYETNKTNVVAQKYQFRIFPLDFVGVHRSAFLYDSTPPGSAGDYTHTVIKVKDIYPFVLNGSYGSQITIRSFSKLHPSALDGRVLNVSGFCLGSYLQKFSDRHHKFDPNKYYPINPNSSAFDRPGIPGILEFSDSKDNYIDNRRIHAIREMGKAYALAPNVRPNIITDAQVLVKDKNWIYALVLFLIIAGAYLEKNKKQIKWN